MSDRLNVFKKLIFDTCIWTYTLALVVYVPIFLLGDYDQEYFITHFSDIAMIALLAFVGSAIGSCILHRYKIATVASLLFSTWTRVRVNTAGKVHLIFLFALTLFVSIQVTETSFYELLDRDGIRGAFRLWSGLTAPNFAIFPKAVLEAIETIFIAFLATVIAIPLAFLLAFFCAKNLMTHPFAFSIYSFLRLVLNVSRSVEPLIWALIFTVWVGVGPFAGMLALTIHSVASLAKYYSEIIENVDEGPLDGVRSTGANPLEVIWYALVPQVLLPYIAMTVYRWDTNVRMATVIGLVGGGGIGTLLIQYQGQAQWREVGCIILVVAIIVWLMDTASAYIREALK